METKIFYNQYEINALREIRRASKNEGMNRQGLASIPINNGFVKTEIEPFNHISQTELENAFYQVKKDLDRILIPL